VRGRVALATSLGLENALLAEELIASSAGVGRWVRNVESRFVTNCADVLRCNAFKQMQSGIIIIACRSRRTVLRGGKCSYAEQIVVVGMDLVYLGHDAVDVVVDG
jgi:hypothetical protein